MQKKKTVTTTQCVLESTKNSFKFTAKLYKELSIEVRSAKMFALLFDKIIIKNKLFYIIF